MKIKNLIVHLMGGLTTLVVGGWLYDVELLKSAIPGHVSMKLSTAFAFIMQLIATYIIINERRTKRGDALLVACSMFTFLFMSFGMCGAFHIGSEAGIHSVGPGVPSLMTMFMFVVLAFIEIFYLVRDTDYRQIMDWICKFCMWISGTAMVGHILNVPEMFYYFEGYSTGMAFHTSVMFFLIGLVHMPIKHLDKMLAESYCARAWDWLKLKFSSLTCFIA